MTHLDVQRYAEALANAGYTGKLSLQLKPADFWDLVRELESSTSWRHRSGRYAKPIRSTDKLWVATSIGYVECSLDGAEQELERQELAQQLAWGAPA